MQWVCDFNRSARGTELSKRRLFNGIFTVKTFILHNGKATLSPLCSSSIPLGELEIVRPGRRTNANVCKFNTKVLSSSKTLWTKKKAGKFSIVLRMQTFFLCLVTQPVTIAMYDLRSSYLHKSFMVFLYFSFNKSADFLQSRKSLFFAVQLCCKCAQSRQFGMQLTSNLPEHCHL